MSTKLSVLNPMGFPPKVRGRGLAPALDSLDGKKLFLVDVGWEDSDKFMLEVQRWLARHEPGLKTEIVRWKDQHQPDPVLSDRMKAEGDAVILGVGH